MCRVILVAVHMLHVFFFLFLWVSGSAVDCDCDCCTLWTYHLIVCVHFPFDAFGGIRNSIVLVPDGWRFLL